MLEIKDLQIRYAGQGPAVDGFSMSLGHGEIVSIVGESGSGKTSVIRAVMGLLPAGGEVRGGKIFLEGQSLLALDKNQWQKLRGRELSMIFQDAGVTLNPIRSIGAQYVEYIRTHQKTPRYDARQRATDMLRAMGLADPENVLKNYPFQLSGGMRQRVGIAMAMTFQPKILLADEPTSALDVTTQAQIVRQIAALRQQFGTSIILVTHNLGVAAYLSDRIIVMKEGAILEQGDRETILKHPQNAYTQKLLDAVPVLGGKMYV